MTERYERYHQCNYRDDRDADEQEKPAEECVCKYEQERKSDNTAFSSCGKFACAGGEHIACSSQKENQRKTEKQEQSEKQFVAPIPPHFPKEKHRSTDYYDRNNECNKIDELHG